MVGAPPRNSSWKEAPKTAILVLFGTLRMSVNKALWQTSGGRSSLVVDWSLGVPSLKQEHEEFKVSTLGVPNFETC
jgi:hypothetical protein